MKQQIEHLIAHNQLEEAIDQLFQLFTICLKQQIGGDLQEEYKHLILISGKLAGTVQDAQLGTITTAEANAAKAQVRNALLAEIQSIPQSVFEAIKPFENESVLSTDADSLRGLITKNKDQTYEYDIFLSFSSKDIDWVRNLCHELRGYGLRVFFSDDNLRLRAGEPFLQTISNALINSKNFLLVCTPNAMESKYVRIEYETFHQECTMNDEENRLFMIYSGAKSFHKDLVPLIYRRLHYATSVDNLIKALAGKQGFIKTEPIIDLVEQQRQAKTEAEARLKSMQENARHDEINSINKEKKQEAQAEQSLWQSAFKANTLAGYQNYQAKYPMGQYAKEAAQFINILTPITKPPTGGTTFTKTIQVTKSNTSKSKNKTYYTIAAIILIIFGATYYIETRQEVRFTQSEPLDSNNYKTRINENRHLTINPKDQAKETDIKKGESKLSPAQLKDVGVTLNPAESLDEKAWTEAKNNANKKAYKKYLVIYPNGKHKVEAQKEIDKTKEEQKINNIGKFDYETVFVVGGTFQMGSNDGSSDEKPIHSVTVSRFNIGKYEVSQAQWKAVMGKNPSDFKNCDNCPVENVSWNDIELFIKKVKEQTSKTYRLPTEAEWEFAARGGTSSSGYKYAGSNNLGGVAWYIENSGSKTHPVGQKQANELGIYDMNGNVLEWCQDWYKAYLGNSDVFNYTGSFRVTRGGSWSSIAGCCRSAYRGSYSPASNKNDLGLRLVFVP